MCVLENPMFQSALTLIENELKEPFRQKDLGVCYQCENFSDEIAADIHKNLKQLYMSIVALNRIIESNPSINVGMMDD